MKRDRFEKLVGEAIDELPAEFQQRLENVLIIVEDYPSRELLDQMEISSDETLFGLYEGTPLPERGFQSPLSTSSLVGCDLSDERSFQMVKACSSSTTAQMISSVFKFRVPPSVLQAAWVS